MDWSQEAYLASLGLALIIGRPAPVVVLAMVGNLLATMILTQSLVAVAVADLAAAAVLLGGGERAVAVAALFAVMVPVYFAAYLAGWPAATTYAIVDALAYLQCGIIAHVDHGMGRLARGVGGFFGARRVSMAARGNAREGVAAPERQGK